MSTSRKSSTLRLAIVLLAAGEGSRLGSIPKGLLRKDGKTILESFCSAAQQLVPVEFVAITGFHASAIEAELKRVGQSLQFPMTVVRNPNANEGQASSVRLALESLRSQYDVLAVCLSDQPNIGITELQALLEQFDNLKGKEQILMPMVNGQRGNPVLFSRQSVQEILLTPAMVCRAYMDKYPELVQVFETDNPAFILDVDTENDIQSLGISRP